ncbi:hypothetical protein B0H14DRAFT_3495582 [Mycena olivaceomarginata]|nr:hypothetical protein B0H14DRAFT_3495582 [Mycena olivaceomarginata]
MADAPSRVPGWMPSQRRQQARRPPRCAPTSNATLRCSTGAPRCVRATSACPLIALKAKPRLNSCSLAARANCKPRRRLHDEMVMDTVLSSPPCLRCVSADVHAPGILSFTQGSLHSTCSAPPASRSSLTRWWRWTLRLSSTRADQLKWTAPALHTSRKTFALEILRFRLHITADS